MFGTIKTGILLMAVVAMLCAASPAQAESRDAGMGRVLAQQGNQALQLIRLELKATIRALAPRLPQRPGSKILALAPVNGVGAKVHCAE